MAENLHLKVRFLVPILGTEDRLTDFEQVVAGPGRLSRQERPGVQTED